MPSSRSLLFASAITCIAILVTSGHVVAEEKSSPEWIIKPTEQHKLLKEEVGTWNATVKVWPKAGSPPIESKGVEKNRLMKGGLWLLSRFEGELVGEPFIGVGTFGYDPAEKKFVGVWADNMTPHMMVMKSEYDPKTNATHGTAETRDPITGEKYTARILTRYGDDSRVMEMHRTDDKGKEWKVMEISYKRAEE